MFDEQSLIERVLTGDEDALGRMVDHLEPQVYSYALRYLGREEEAKQATIETMNRVCRSLNRNMDVTLRLWTLRTAAEVCADIQRLGRGAKSTMAVFRMREPTSRTGNSEEDLKAATQMQLLRLTRQQREVILLRDLSGLSDAETGQVLKLNIDGVRARVSRARKNLRELLIRQEVLPAPKGRGTGRECQHFQELCSEYVDECITDADKSALLDHIQECPHCAAYLNDLTAIGRALAHMEEEKPPEELREQVLQSAREQPREQRKLWALRMRFPVVALVAFAALFTVLTCSGVLGGLFINTSVPTEARRQSEESLSEDLTIPESVTELSYSYVFAAAGSAGLPELSASADLIIAENGVEYYRVDGGLEVMQKLAEGMESVGYQLESVSNDQLVITPNAAQGLFIVIRQSAEE